MLGILRKFRVLRIVFCFGGKFMQRRPMRAGKDKRIFSRTAKKIKKINVNPRIMRGGIRM